MAYCPPCHRSFRLESSLVQHIRDKHPHTYCWRCERHFPHSRAKEQHIADSSQHHVCTRCRHEPDFASEEGLDKHLEEVHHVCVPCNEFFYSQAGLLQHDVKYHNKCEICDRFFDSRSHLLNHRKVHAMKDVQCLGCTRMFISNSAMMLHLESGTCESGVGLRWVKERVGAFWDNYWSWCYNRDPANDFRCSDCDIRFDRMGALLQHVESEACDARIYDRPLRSILEYIKGGISYM